jgi:AraC family transcriptional regulator
MDGNGYQRRLQDAIDFIEVNLRDELRLGDVSRIANASLYHFHRLFRASVGESLGEYIRHRRLTRAAQDLVTTKKTIIDVALDYRYSTPESFLRAFKAMFGKTPSAFRKKRRFTSIHTKADLEEKWRL